MAELFIKRLVDGPAPGKPGAIGEAGSILTAGSGPHRLWRFLSLSFALLVSDGWSSGSSLNFLLTSRPLLKARVGTRGGG